MYLHCWKIYNLFVRALETDRKEILWRAVLFCFAASANAFYIFRTYVYCVYPAMLKSPNQLSIV